MKSLKDRIWETRKTRILAAERLLKYMKHSEILIPYYSIFLIAITILPKTINQDIINFASVLGSVFVIVISLLISNQKFEKRATDMKNQYIKLQGLLTRLEKDSQSCDKIDKEYSLILSETENHKQADYLKLMIQLRNDKESTVNKPSLIDFIQYFYSNFCCILLFVLAYMSPIVFIFYMLVK